MVASVRSEEYYINMMIAWYFATALAKQYDAVLPFITEKRLDDWTHNKAIQKCVESDRITPEQKEYLKTLKVKAGKWRRQKMYDRKRLEIMRGMKREEFLQFPWSPAYENSEAIKHISQEDMLYGFLISKNI